MRYKKENVLAVILGIILTLAVSFYSSFMGVKEGHNEII